MATGGAGVPAEEFEPPSCIRLMDEWCAFCRAAPQSPCRRRTRRPYCARRRPHASGGSARGLGPGCGNIGWWAIGETARLSGRGWPTASSSKESLQSSAKPRFHRSPALSPPWCCWRAQPCAPRHPRRACCRASAHPARQHEADERELVGPPPISVCGTIWPARDSPPATWSAPCVLLRAPRHRHGSLGPLTCAPRKPPLGQAVTGDVAAAQQMDAGNGGDGLRGLSDRYV